MLGLQLNWQGSAAMQRVPRDQPRNLPELLRQWSSAQKEGMVL
jgi:hypothetical protein